MSRAPRRRRPSGLQGGGSLGAAGGVSTGPGGPILTGKGGSKGKDLGDRQLFRVTVTGDISGSGVTTPTRDPEYIYVASFDPFLVLGSFFEILTCGGGPSIVGGQTVTAGLGILEGRIDDQLHLRFGFTHNGAEHRMQLLGRKPGNWPPLTAAGDVTVRSLNGDWEVTSKKNQDGCTGAGGQADGTPIDWTATIVPTP